MTRSYGIHTICTTLLAASQRSKIVSVVYLVVNIIELSYETWYTIANDNSSDRMMLYRSRIGDNLHEISHTCLLGLGAAVVTLAYEPGVLGAVGRDQGRFQ